MVPLTSWTLKMGVSHWNGVAAKPFQWLTPFIFYLDGSYLVKKLRYKYFRFGRRHL